MNDSNTVSWPGWETTRLLGQGSFGAVYEIRRTLPDGTVEDAALKVIHLPKEASDIDELRSDGYDDESITTRYRGYLGDIVREYTLMKEIKGHTNVVYCDDLQYYPQANGVGWDVYIKMELLTPLTKTLGPEIDPEVAVKLGKNLCAALELCREKGILHRDIKPQNIFVSKDGDYKLGDFGIAKTAEKTTGGTKIGTYKYMAPEVYNNEPYGGAADQYSLGLVLYWLLNERRTPFLPLPPEVPGAAEEDKARQRRFSGETLPPPKNGSEALKRIVLKACAFDPKDRYATPGEMLAALNALTDGTAYGAEPEDEGTTGGWGRSSVREPEDEGTAGAWGRSAAREPEEDATVGAWGAKTGGNTAKHSPTGNAAQDHRTTQPKNTVQQPPQPRKKKGNWLIRIGVAALAFALAYGIGYLVNGGKLGKTETVTTADPSATSQVWTAWTPSPTAVAPTWGPTWSPSSYSTTDSETDATPAPTAAVEPSWGRNVTSVAASFDIVLGVKENGHVLKVENETGFHDADVSNWTDAVQAVSNGWTSAALKSDGTCLGDWLEDEPEWTDIVQLAAGSYSLVGLKSDGTAVATGATIVGSNDEADWDVSAWTNLKGVASGYRHTVGLKKDGTVVAVGQNDKGQCDVSGWSGIQTIAAGGDYTVGITAYNTIVCTGGYLDWSNITAVSVSPRRGGHVVGLRSDGTVVASGANDYGQCNVSAWTDVISIAAGNTFTVGVRSDGTMLYAGSSDKIDLSELRYW